MLLSIHDIDVGRLVLDGDDGEDEEKEKRERGKEIGTYTRWKWVVGC